MSGRLTTILLLAFVIAGISAFLVFRLVSKRVAAPPPSATTSVVAAAADIKLGTVLNSSHLTTIQIAGPLPKGAITNPAAAIGRGVLSDLYQGEPIIESRLAANGSGGGLASTIPPGMRACAVKVDDVVGVAGFVTPGMRVDVVISGVPPGELNATQGSVARTILQNIQVLSAGTDIQKDAEGKPQQVQVVNLLVTPEQAETLSLASNQVKIQLVLRNPLDTKISPVAGTATGTLFADPNAKPTKLVKKTGPKKPAPFTIEILNGSKLTQQQFPNPEAKH